MPRFLALGLVILALGGPARLAHAQAEAPAEAAAAAPAPRGGAAHGEEKPNILKGDIALAISTLVVFFVLLVVLGKFAWKPLLKALHDREERLERTVEETERARAESERLLAEHHKQMEQATEQVRALLDEARRDAQVTADDIIKKAQAEAEAARHRAEREIGNARDQALIDIWNRAADLAVSVAGKVLTRELSPADHSRLVEQATRDLPASPTATNGHGSHA